MKAIICIKRFIGCPSLQDVAKPAPKDDEVLIKIHAASINSRVIDHKKRIQHTTRK